MFLFMYLKIINLFKVKKLYNYESIFLILIEIRANIIDINIYKSLQLKNKQNIYKFEINNLLNTQQSIYLSLSVNKNYHSTYPLSQNSKQLQTVINKHTIKHQQYQHQQQIRHQQYQHHYQQLQEQFIIITKQEMQSLIEQNSRLRQIMQKCQQQIIQLRKIGQQHQEEIDNLLKFNQRLLSIIQNQMPNKTITRTPSGANLHPIDEAAGEEKEHQLVVNNNNLQKMALVNNIKQHRFNRQQQQHQQAIRERVEHLQKQQVDHLKQQDKNYTHYDHHYNNSNEQIINNDNKNNISINKRQQENDYQNTINHLPMTININNNNNNYNTYAYDNDNKNTYAYNNQYQQLQQNNNINQQKQKHHQYQHLKFTNTQSYSPRSYEQQQSTNNYNQYINHENNKHINYNNNNNYMNKDNNNPQKHTINQQQQNQYYQQFNDVIYRQQKQSLIDVPKLFKLQKSLNQHYHKQLFHSIQQQQQLENNNNNNNTNNTNNNTNNNNKHYLNSLNNKQPRKFSIPSQASQLMGKFSQAQTQRIPINQQQLKQQFQSIRRLINQYKQDFNLQEYLHLCQIIKNDLQNDLSEINQTFNQRVKVLVGKQRQCERLSQGIKGFNAVDNIVQIMKRLNISKQTQKMVLNRVTGQYYQQQQPRNDNTTSNVSIMARNR